MRLKALRLKNFRAYKDDTLITFDKLTALIGRNDIGKSSILEALGIFLGDQEFKFDSSDKCVYAEGAEVRIGCVFTDLPEEIVLDSSAVTSLRREFLINDEGDLEIHRIFVCGEGKPKESVVAFANHPTAPLADDLLLLKLPELRKRISDLGIDTADVDLRSKSAIRQAIWHGSPDLQLGMKDVPLSKEDAKDIWDQISKELPLFVLFKADRPSTDDDSEVQDPMKLAVKQALLEVQNELELIKDKVRDKALDVAQRTLRKLQEFDEDLARELSPTFKGDPKWDNVFKLSLTSDDQIPINKRGSGVRRLILFSFFRAEAERRKSEAQRFNIIYAIEEPETSQHPDNQRLLVETFLDLASEPGCQVILTTHVPGLAGLLPVESLRYIMRNANGDRVVQSSSDETYQAIASDLGVLPEVSRNRVEVIVCVEGPHDIEFLKHMASLLRQQDTEIPELGVDPRVAIIPLGGSTLKDWVSSNYLKQLGLPEVHIYDRDEQIPPKYQEQCEMVNARGDGSVAILTAKREAENYLHSSAISSVFGITVDVDDLVDVPNLVAKAQHSAAPGANPWEDLEAEKIKKKEGRAKYRLNREVAAAMTYEMLVERGGAGEITAWFGEVANRLTQVHQQTPFAEK